MIPVLETERLTLRAWRESDLDAYADFCANEATARFTGGVCGRDDAWRRIAMFLGHWTLRGYGNWALEAKSDGAFVGYCGLWSPEGWPGIELMWGLAAASQGRGFATEAATRVRRYAYGDMQLNTLVSTIAPENAPSQAVARRLGAVHESQTQLRGLTVGVYRHPGPEQINPQSKH